MGATRIWPRPPDSETNQGASDVREGAFGAMKGASGDDDTCQEGALSDDTEIGTGERTMRPTRI